MPIMFGFARQRRQMLEAELERFIEEMPQLGLIKMWIYGDLSSGNVTPDSELELVLLQVTDEPWHRRGDFWMSHLRPRVGSQFYVFTPEEFDSLSHIDPVLVETIKNGESVYG